MKDIIDTFLRSYVVTPYEFFMLLVFWLMPLLGAVAVLFIDHFLVELRDFFFRHIRLWPQYLYYMRYRRTFFEYFGFPKYTSLSIQTLVSSFVRRNLHIIYFLAIVYFYLNMKPLIFFNLQQPKLFREAVIYFFDMPVTFGLDGMSLIFLFLTTLLTIYCVLNIVPFVEHKRKELIFWLLIMQFLLVGAFSTLNLLFFYVFFEALLIPMYLIIGVWGSRSRKIRAAYLFFLYTLAGSLLFLSAIIYIYSVVGSLNLNVVFLYKFPLEVQKYLWLAFFASFAVKIPMVPFHIWLPEAHVEAPTVGSVLLAGILLKLGGYGFIRFLLPICPEACVYFSPLVYCLVFFGVIYISLITLIQHDLKRIIAYSSIAHMNLVVLAIFSHSITAIYGSVFLMFSHGVVSAGLFYCIGIIYSNFGSRILYYLGGLAHIMPQMSFYFFVLTMSNIALPGTSGFIGEFLIIQNAFRNNTFISVSIILTVVLTAAYSLFLFNRLFYGSLNLNYLPIKHLENEVDNPYAPTFYRASSAYVGGSGLSFLKAVYFKEPNSYWLKFRPYPLQAYMNDISRQESVLLICLVSLTVFFGIFPNSILDLMKGNMQYFINLPY